MLIGQLVASLLSVKTVEIACLKRNVYFPVDNVSMQSTSGTAVRTPFEGLIRPVIGQVSSSQALQESGQAARVPNTGCLILP